MAVTLVLASVLLFGILNLAPGGPFDARVAANHIQDPTYLERLNKLIGLDKPVPVRYFLWLQRLVQGDLGNSTQTGQAVTLASVFMPVGFQPAAGALLVSLIGLAIGLPCISLWALFGVAIGRFLGNARRQRVFNAIMGGALAVLALMLIR